MLQALKRDKAFYRYLVSLTAPIALQNLITFSLGLIDTLMVSRLGNDEMAAVTAANVPVFLLISIVFGVQSGVGILISQYWGKKDLPSISRVIGVAALLGISLALIVAVVLFAWPVAIMDLLSNKHHLSLLGAPYLRLIGFSYVFNMLSSIYVSAQRSVENAGFGMKLFGMSTVLVNELFWGLGNSLLTVILGHTTVSVAFLAANGVMGNLNRLFLVVCFGLGAATAVMVGKAIGEGQSHDELMALAKTLSWVTILVGAVLAVIALVLVPLLFQPVIFPLFELYGLSAHLATTLAVTGFACIPLHAYSISAVTGILRAGGDVLWSTALDLAPQWVLALPLTALLALVLDADPWFVSLAIQAESFLKCPICLWRIRSRKWIHDVTLPEGRENG